MSILFSGNAEKSKEERKMLAITEIIQYLVDAHYANRDVNLNKLKSQISSKYQLENTPRLVDIIAAVPEEHKAILIPKLKAKPIRTASGVSNHKNFFKKNDKITNGRLRSLLAIRIHLILLQC